MRKTWTWNQIYYIISLEIWKLTKVWLNRKKAEKTLKKREKRRGMERKKIILRAIQIIRDTLGGGSMMCHTYFLKQCF